MTTTAADEDWLKALIKAQLFGKPELAPSVGRFQLLRLLGRGATGSVYEARDRATGARVALKYLTNVDHESLARFKQEFRNHADLLHEQLVHLHELFVDGNDWYFTMELVEGRTFDDFIAHGTSNVEGLRAVTRSLLSAVHAIHEYGRLHCDLKPNNVLVGDAGRVVVLDFGLSTAIKPAMAARIGRDARTRVHGSGTPPYMAPELLEGGLPTTASDAYAVGVMLRRALQLFSKLARGAAESRDEVECVRADGISAEIPADLRTVCLSLLEREPRARMSIHEALSHLGGAREARLPARSPAFVGREVELPALQRALVQSQSSGPVAVLITGPSGIGKTRLCDQFAGALGSDALVLRGRCHERESLPYKAFDGIVDALAEYLMSLPLSARPELDARALRALARVFPSLADALWRIPEASNVPALGEPEIRRRACLALKSVLRAVALRRPLVLIVDDLHWADLDSARLLFELLEPPLAPRLLYVGCFRSEETAKSEFVREVLSREFWAHGCRRVQLSLQRLDKIESAALARSLLGRCPARGEDVIERIVQESRGVPFVVRELANYFDNSADSDADAVSLASVLAGRIEELAPTARYALELIALAGRPVSWTLLANALESRPRWERALRTLVTSGLVRSNAAGELTIYHDQLATPIAQLITAENARALHRLLAERYEALMDAEPQWLLTHWQAAGERDRARGYALAAAERAADKLAFHRAAALYRTALSLSDARDPARPRLARERAEALVNAGRSAEAAEAFIEAAESCESELNLVLRCRAMQQYLRSGQQQRGMALLRELLEAVELPYPKPGVALVVILLVSHVRLAISRRRERALAEEVSSRTRRRLAVLRSAFRELMFLDPLRGALLLRLFHEYAWRARDREATFVALACETYIGTFRGGAAATRRTARRVAELEKQASTMSEPHIQPTLALVQSAVAVFEGRYCEAGALARQAHESFVQHCPGTYWEELICTNIRFAALEVTGPLTTLSEEARRYLAYARDRGDRASDTIVSRALPLAYLAQDQPARAMEYLKERSSPVTASFDMHAWLVAASLADCLSYMDDPAGAFESCERLWSHFRRSSLYQSQYLRVASHQRHARTALALALRLGDSALLSVAERHLEAIAKARRPITLSLPVAARAAIASQRGAMNQARSELKRAEQLALGHGMIVSALCMRHQRGSLGGADARHLIKEADHALTMQGIANPARWTEMVAPGFRI